MAKTKSKKAAASAPEENGEAKVRGRQRDVERDNELTDSLLEAVEVVGEFPNHRFKGIGEAAKDLGIDNIRALGLLNRRLAEEAGLKEATPEAVYNARHQDFLGWGAIDAMFGLTRSQSHALYDEYTGESESWRNAHLHGEGGIKPKPEKAPSTRKSGPKTDGKPVFSGDEEVDAIVKKVDGKNITLQLHDKSGNTLGQQKVAVQKGSAKVVTTKSGGRALKFNDGSKSRTIRLESIVKVGGR